MAADYDLPDSVEKRARFFDGQYLQDQDFVDEQKYHLDRRRRHNRLLHVAGVAEGLDVSTDTPFEVVVSEGTAVDRDGRPLVLARKHTETLPNSDADKTLSLYIHYGEERADKQTETGSEDYSRWLERPVITTNPSDTKFPPVLLANLTLDASGTVSIDKSPREYSGLRLPGPSPESPTLRADAQSRARLDGDLSITRNLSVSGNPGFGTTTSTDRLAVDGSLRILPDSNPIRFTSKWDGIPDASPNQAEIANDVGEHKTLMIVGNRSRGGKRRVTIREQLVVNGTLKATEKVGIGRDPTTNALEVEGTVSATKFLGDGAIPAGVIVMWSGAAIPAGWALCDGTAEGRPDLRDRFIVGADGGYPRNSKGEPDTHQHTVDVPREVVNTSSAGGHAHKPPNAWTDRGYSGAGGYHGIDRGAPGVKDVWTSTVEHHTHTVQFDIGPFPSHPSAGNRPKWYALAFIIKL